MKIILSLSNLNQLNNTLDYADFVMASNEEIAITISHSFTIEELLVIKEKALGRGRGFVLALDLMLHEEKIALVNRYLDAFADDIYYYVTDLGVVELLKKRNLLGKTIYNPRTMVTNYLDFNMYAEDGIMAIGVSTEIPLKDVALINDKKQTGLFYLGFGIPLMFHSRRELVSLYQAKMQKDFAKEQLMLREQTRDDLYPIFENSNGTMIYRSYFSCLVKEYLTLKTFDYVFLDSLLVSDDKYLIIAQIFADLIKGIIGLEEAISQFNTLGLNCQDGFIYQDTVYVKEPTIR